MSEESELRAQLMLAGFSNADIEAGIQVARTWATTTIRRTQSERNTQ